MYDDGDNENGSDDTLYSNKFGDEPNRYFISISNFTSGMGSLSFFFFSSFFNFCFDFLSPLIDVTIAFIFG